MWPSPTPTLVLATGDLREKTALVPSILCSWLALHPGGHAVPLTFETPSMFHGLTLAITGERLKSRCGFPSGELGVSKLLRHIYLPWRDILLLRTRRRAAPVWYATEEIHALSLPVVYDHFHSHRSPMVLLHVTDHEVFYDCPMIMAGPVSGSSRIRLMCKCFLLVSKRVIA